jgi:hypothetical protein
MTFLNNVRKVGRLVLSFITSKYFGMRVYPKLHSNVKASLITE